MCRGCSALSQSDWINYNSYAGGLLLRVRACERELGRVWLFVSMLVCCSVRALVEVEMPMWLL